MKNREQALRIARLAGCISAPSAEKSLAGICGWNACACPESALSLFVESHHPLVEDEQAVFLALKAMISLV